MAAQLAKAECMKQAMTLNYLLNKKYAPHDKWLFKGMPDNPEMRINEEGIINESVASLVEKIGMLPVDKAHERELATAVESLAVILQMNLRSRIWLAHVICTLMPVQQNLLQKVMCF